MFNSRFGVFNDRVVHVKAEYSIDHVNGRIPLSAITGSAALRPQTFALNVIGHLHGL